LKVTTYGLAFLLLALFGSPAFAQVRYEYDSLGRLIRVIDGQGRAAIYVYGPTGNILQIVRDDGSSGGPTITSVSPGVVRKGRPRAIQIVGTNLAAATVSTSDPLVALSVQQASATQLVVTVTPAANATVGTKTLTIGNSSGSTTASIEVRAAIALSVAPSPTVMPPDSLTHAVSVQLSDSDPAATVFNISGLDVGVAIASPASVTVPSGQTEFQITVKGLSPGRTSFVISGSSMSAAQSFPLFVSANSSPLSARLGVYLGVSPAATPLIVPSKSLGVDIGTLDPSVPMSLVTPVVDVFVESP